MPPPLPIESDAESIAEEIPHTKAELAKAESADTKMKDQAEDEEEEEEEEGDEDEEVFIVESIKDHRSDFEDGQMRYDVKWKGYEKKADRTWETEENLQGARGILEAYWKSLPDGKPVPAEPKSTKKRGRQSTGGGGKQPDTSKRPKMSRKGRKSNGGLEQDTTPTPLIGYTDAGDDDWKPPAPTAGAWDPLVQSVDTVVRENSDGELWGFVIWNDKNEDGRFYRSKAKLPVIYKACPQRMLHFYEKHLVFSTNTADAGADAGSDEKAAE